jgi:small-conductance mechanosensitive channel
MYWGNSLRAWLVAGLLAAVSFALLLIVKRILLRKLSRLAALTATELDDLLVELIRRTRPLFLALASLYIGSIVLRIPESSEKLVGKPMSLVVVLQGAIWINGIVTFFIGRLTRHPDGQPGAPTMIGKALTFMGQLIVWSLAVLLVLDNLGVNVTALVTGLGIGGVAVALALQNVLGDLFASLSIVLDKPFEVGDFINVDNLNGTVESVGLKTTRVRSLTGEQPVFSNADLVRSRIRNYKRMAERRVVFTVAVTFQTHHEKVATINQICREAVQAQPQTRFDRSHFLSFGESGLVFEIVYYVTTSDYLAYMDSQQAINLAIQRRFEEAGIRFAYPTRTVYMQQLPASP